MKTLLKLALPVALAFLFLAPCEVRAQILPGEPPPPLPTPKPTPTPEPKDEDYEVVRVTSSLVVVPVSVADEKGQPVLGLKLGDFRLEEEGKTQAITQLGDPEQNPLDIAILLDVSGSVDARFAFEQQAAASFLKHVLKPGDRATVFAIDEKPRLIQGLTTAEAASQKLMAVSSSKSYTAFFDTVIEAARYLEKTSTGGRRRVIIAISDGDDTARILEVSSEQSRSKDFRLLGMEDQLRLVDRSVAEVQREVQRAEITFYSLNPSGQTMHLNVRTARAEKGLEKIAEVTGGSAFIPNRLEELGVMFDRIATELRSQYLLQYYSNNERPSNNYLRIKVAVPARPNVGIRARQGYFSKGRKS